MRPLNEWLDEYGESHQNPANKLIHWLCVPAIVFSVVALLWAIPVPRVVSELSPWFNWATLAVVLALVFYFIMSVTIGVGMSLFALVCLTLSNIIDNSSGLSLWMFGLTIFVLAWIFQFIGHKLEGKKPSFFKDIAFLLIGPAWLLSFIYRRLGIPY